MEVYLEVFQILGMNSVVVKMKTDIHRAINSGC
jgi:hypothetical protein